MKADLHLHSIFSDGKLKPDEIVKLALEKNLECISLTDHDSCEGTEIFRREAKKNKLKTITGIELSSYIGPKEIHILGYFFDHEDSKLLKKLRDLRSNRKSRILKMIEKLHSLGANITIKDVEKYSKKGLYGRLHIALALFEKGYVKKPDDSFSIYIGNNKPAFVKKESFEPEDAVKLIKNAGGLSVLAHPYSSGLNETEIKTLVKCGIKGIEVFHPKHSYKQEVDLKKLCSDNLVMTGGSDFHGFEKYEYERLGTKFTTLDEIRHMESIVR